MDQERETGELYEEHIKETWVRKRTGVNSLASSALANDRQIKKERFCRTSIQIIGLAVAKYSRIKQ